MTVYMKPVCEQVFTARCYANTDRNKFDFDRYAMAPRLSVCLSVCHKPVFY